VSHASRTRVVYPPTGSTANVWEMTTPTYAPDGTRPSLPFYVDTTEKLVTSATVFTKDWPTTVK